MIDFVIATFSNAVILVLGIQLFIYVTASSCSYRESWTRTGAFFMRAFALEPGPDRKLGIAALLLMTYVVGVLCFLELLSRAH